MSTREKVQFSIKAAIFVAVVVVIAWTDITVQMSYTEDVRSGLFEAAYQRSLKGGTP